MRYAVIKDGKVVNVIEIQENDSVQPVEDEVNIGWTVKGKTFVAPKEKPIDPE